MKGPPPLVRLLMDMGAYDVAKDMVAAMYPSHELVIERRRKRWAIRRKTKAR
jgi:hypothetical protein